MAHHHPKNISYGHTGNTPEHLTAKDPMLHQINLNLSQILGEHQNGTRKETGSNQSP
jgi:hypothetical protein